MALANPPVGAPVALSGTQPKPRFGRIILRALEVVGVVALVILVAILGMTVASQSSELDKTKAELKTQRQVADYAGIFYIGVAGLGAAQGQFNEDYFINKDEAAAKADLAIWQQRMTDVTSQLQAKPVPSSLAVADKHVKAGLQAMATAIATLHDGISRNDQAAVDQASRLVVQADDEFNSAIMSVRTLLSP